MIQLDKLYHVGIFDSKLKGTTHNASSQEGNGLSVSIHPEEWREIARLGEDPLWELEPKDAGVFVDHHALTDAHWQRVMEWATENGYATPTQVVRASWHDEELDERRYFEFDLSEPDAMERAQAEADDREDDDPRIEKHAGWKSTTALDERIGYALETSMVQSMVLTLYTEDVLYATDKAQGVWWEDTLDVQGLSAPRGVIHLQALSTWASKQVEAPTLDEDLDDLNHRDHEEQLQTTGFWGKQAAGCLFLARDTGRLLIAHRSDEVLEPNTWGTWGGAMDRGETPEAAVLREVDEETEHNGPRLALPLAVFSHESGFKYHNYLVVVDEEFEPTLNWESQDYAWVGLDEMPSPLHPGVKYLLEQSRDDIARFIETRADLPDGAEPSKAARRIRP